MIKPNWSAFEMRVLLNRPDAKQRWADSLLELDKAGLKNVLRFAALPANGPHQSFNASVNAIIKAFYNGTGKTLLFMEDDIQFRDLKHLNAAINELPIDWDILYLGANLWGDQINARPERFSPHLCRIYGAWTTHCFAINRKVAKFIIDNQPAPHEGMADAWLSSNLHLFKAFCVTPMLAYQRPDLSYIWGHRVDYTDIFQLSDNLLLNTK